MRRSASLSALIFSFICRVVQRYKSLFSMCFLMDQLILCEGILPLSAANCWALRKVGYSEQVIACGGQSEKLSCGDPKEGGLFSLYLCSRRGCGCGCSYGSWMARCILQRSLCMLTLFSILASRCDSASMEVVFCSRWCISCSMACLAQRMSLSFSFSSCSSFFLSCSCRRCCSKKSFMCSMLAFYFRRRLWSTFLCYSYTYYSRLINWEYFCCSRFVYLFLDLLLLRYSWNFSSTFVGFLGGTDRLPRFILSRQERSLPSSPSVIHLSCSSLILPSIELLITSTSFSTCLKLMSQPQFFMNFQRSSAQTQSWRLLSIAKREPLTEQSFWFNNSLRNSMSFISLFMISRIISRKILNCSKTCYLLEYSISGCYSRQAISYRSYRLSLGSRKVANSSLLTSPALRASIQVKAQVSSLRCLVPMTACRSFSQRQPFSCLSRSLKRARESKQGELAMASRQASLVSLMSVISASICASMFLEWMESICCWQQAIAVYYQFYQNCHNRIDDNHMRNWF